MSKLLLDIFDFEMYISKMNKYADVYRRYLSLCLRACVCVCEYR